MSVAAVNDWLDAQEFSGSEPGFAIGLAQRGRTLLTRGVGMAHVNPAVPLISSTPMRAFSIAKQFTCLAYARLAAQGALDLDTSFADHLPDLAPGLIGVSARQLMTHSSGLLDVCDMHWSFGSAGRRVDSEDLIRYYAVQRHRNFAPGSGWCYNNGGYQLIAAAIEKVTGQPLEMYMQDLIFRPLGMTATSIVRSSAGMPSDAADLHVVKGGSFAPNQGELAGDLSGDAGLVTSAEDLLVWLAAIERGTRDNCPIALALLQQPQRLSNGFDTQYGLGIAQGRYAEMATVFHPGGGVGGNAHIMSLPEQALNVVVITNRDDLSSREIAEQALDCLFERVREEAHIPAWRTATYHAERSGRAFEFLPGGSSQRRHGSIDGRNVDVVVNPSGALEIDGPLVPMRCRLGRQRESDGSIELRECGEIEHLELISPAKALSLPKNAEFHSPTAGIAVEIDHDEMGGFLHTRCAFGSARFRLVSLGDRVWRALPLESVPWAGGILTFDAEHREFLFTGARARALPFSRVG